MIQTKTNDSGSYLSMKEIRALISSIQDARDRLMLRILYETGCTLVELVNIKVEDILGNKIRIKDQDSDSIRFSQISTKLEKDTIYYIRGNNLQKKSYLLSTRQSGSITEKRVRQLIQFYSQKYISKKINPQMFRYYHITHAYSNGVLLDTIARQLGLTTFRVFQIIDQVRISKQNYNQFLKRV